MTHQPASIQWSVCHRAGEPWQLGLHSQLTFTSAPVKFLQKGNKAVRGDPSCQYSRYNTLEDTLHGVMALETSGLKLQNGFDSWLQFIFNSTKKKT